LTDPDDGRLIQLHPGQTVLVVLRGGWGITGPDDPAVLRPTGPAQTATDPACGPPQTPPGMACGYSWQQFVAVAHGTTAIRAGRSYCGEALRCTPANSRWSVTVSVLP
jgi:hypothetical protein